MKRLISILMIIMMALTFWGCAAKKESASQADRGNGNYTESKAEESIDMDQSAGKDEGEPASPEESPKGADEGRKIIYSANTAMDVKNLNEAYDSIISKAQGMNGYVANSSINENYSFITVRIPAARLDEFLEYVDSLGGDKKETSVATDDVTDQYTDSESRIRNLKAQEEQLLTIMQKAETVEDILKIQNELFRIRGEVESYEGRIKMWDKLVELSTVTVNLHKIQEIGGKEVAVKFISWNEIMKGMSNGFIRTLNFIIRLISGIFIVLISSIPVLPFIAVAAWLIIRYRKKLRNKNISS